MDKGLAQTNKIKEIKGQSCCGTGAERSRESDELKNDLRNPNSNSTTNPTSNQILDLQAQILAIPASKKVKRQDICSA